VSGPAKVTAWLGDTPRPAPSPCTCQPLNITFAIGSLTCSLCSAVGFNVNVVTS
jgi:hypothetical protein